MLLFVFVMSIKIFFGSSNEELVENGRTQYQLLKERANLPQYGSCWKSGVEHLERGCKYLTEDGQSQIALHLTNCFLKMSGHDTYNCESDKKTNLRAICISNMSDRAFNVYTEFYTHIQNICGFLQGHIWHEMITENTIAVGIKLKETAKHQEGLLQAQRESLKLQEKMLKHGKVLENVIEDLFISFKAHQNVLNVLSQTVSNLQNWIVGEMSWIDSIIFNTVAVIFLILFTLSHRTSEARLVIFCLLLINFLIERLICSIYVYISNEDATNMYTSTYNYIWFSRYGFMIITIIILIYFAVKREDPFRKQYELLRLIQKQNSTILNILNNSNSSDTLHLYNVDDTNSINEFLKCSKNDKNLSNQMQQTYFADLEKSKIDSNIINEMLNFKNHSNNSNAKNYKKQTYVNNNFHVTSKDKHISEEKYNLRSATRGLNL